MSTELVQRTPQQTLVATLRGDTFKEQLQMALPPSVTPDHFIRIAATAVLTNPDVANLETGSVLQAFMQCAASGLMPDGKEGAITPRKGKAVFVPMIGGYRKKAAEHGWTLRTNVAYANDQFEHKVVDGEETILHIPVRAGADRGELAVSYAIAKHRDGRKMMTVLYPADIAKRRESASTQKVWDAHPAAMWEKSAGRDLFDQLGLAEGDAAIQRMLNADELRAAADSFYGPSTTPAAPALAAGDAPTDASHRQAVAPAQEQEQAPAASGAGATVPGDDFADEPGDGDEPVATADADIEAAAREAAMFTFPGGKHSGRALGEVFNDDANGGKSYLKWALGQFENKPELRAAVWSFCRFYLPEDYIEALAKMEAQAAS